MRYCKDKCDPYCNITEGPYASTTNGTTTTCRKRPKRVERYCTCSARRTRAAENVKTRGLASSSERQKIYSYFYPLNPLSRKKFHLDCVFDLQCICSLYFCTKTIRKSIDIGIGKQAPASLVETFLFVFSSFSRSRKVYRSKRC